ncbi:hypothetical protein [Halorubrum sodomense]|uniref:Uncharacterized protein n=1 Tax=Halorubrum sodomense TaxID=35743 RepID=A0A1I6G2U3_HALSD|nr:hypothetical protein [Halorubrum sodomense]SFR36482.1 hypothetical protein SAMN04487937_1551 [Halorubrum sodomense]
MKRRNFVLLLGGASSGAMSVGTGAFSSVSAEREVSVNVVEDENAYLGLDQIAHTVSGDDGTRVIQVTNQFGGTLDLTITVDQKGSAIDEIEGEEIEIEDDRGSDDGDEEDDSGEKADENDRCEDDDGVLCIGEEAFITVECEGSGRAELTLRFEGTVIETGTTVDKTRTFEVYCGDEEGDDEGDDEEGDDEGDDEEGDEEGDDEEGDEEGDDEEGDDEGDDEEGDDEGDDEEGDDD